MILQLAKVNKQKPLWYPGLWAFHWENYRWHSYKDCAPKLHLSKLDIPAMLIGDPKYQEVKLKFKDLINWGMLDVALKYSLSGCRQAYRFSTPSCPWLWSGGLMRVGMDIQVSFHKSKGKAGGVGKQTTGTTIVLHFLNMAPLVIFSCH